jgi:hypothetical protein
VRWPAIVGGIVLALACGSRAFADVSQPTTQGLSVGRFILYPSVAMDYTRDDNIFFASKSDSGTDIVSSAVRTIKPNILVSLPIGENLVRWSYSPTYKSYTSSRVDNSKNFSHFFDFEGRFKVGTSLRLVLRDHFLRGTTELREVDPGGETTFGLVPFTLHEPELMADLALGARQGISIIPRYASARFDQLESAPFFNYRKRGVEGRYNYKLGPLDTLYGYYAFDNTSQRREEVGLIDVSQTGRTAGLGFTRIINEIATATISVGYETLGFEGGADQAFAGLVLDTLTTWRPGDTTRIEWSARRGAYPSFFENNNFYLTNTAGFRLIQQIGQQMYCTVSESYQVNRYPLVSPTFGVRRSDRTLHTEVSVGRQFLRSVRVFVGYNRDRRDSNVDPAAYNVDRFTFRIEMGWL